MTYIFKIDNHKYMSYERFTKIISIMEHYPTTTMTHHENTTDVDIDGYLYSIDNEGNLTKRSDNND